MLSSDVLICSVCPQISRLAIDLEALEYGRIVIDLDFEAAKPFVPARGLAVNVRFEVESLDLYSGTYTVSAWLGDEGRGYDTREHVFEFELSTKYEPPQEMSMRAIGTMAVSPRLALL